MGRPAGENATGASGGDTTGSYHEELDRPPIEVFEAISGNRKILADYLRSGLPLSYYTLDAIAAWMADELPPKRKRGNPHGDWSASLQRSVGLKLAEVIYKQRYEAAGRPQGRAEEIALEVAEESQIDPEKFLNFLRRSKSKRHKLPAKRPLMEEMYLAWERSTKSKK